MSEQVDVGVIKYISLEKVGELRYLVSGEGNPLILLHTIRTQLEYFQEVIPALAKHHTVYALDLPGHGGSSIDKSADYNEPYFRQAVSAFIATLNLQGVTLVGEGIGAVLAITVASTMPDQIEKVVASNPYDYETHYADGVRRGNYFASFALANYAIPIFGAVATAFENWFFLGLVLRGGLRIKKWMPKPLLAAINKAGCRKGYRYVERNVFSHWRSWANAREIYLNKQTPCKLIYSEYDWSTQKERRRTAHALGISVDSTITVAGAGHFAFIDTPEKMVKLVLENVDYHWKAFFN